MKRKSRFLTAVVLVLAMLATLAVPVFAMGEEIPAETQGARANGYKTGTFVLSNKTCEYEAGIGASVTLGAYSMINVEDASVGRRHNNLSVTFNTVSSGYQTATGGYKNVTCTGASYSYYVQYSGGMSDVIGYKSVTGTILIFGDRTYTVSLSMN